eukprot:9407008-Prorocentrum_lima.AAC.1
MDGVGNGWWGRMAPPRAGHMQEHEGVGHTEHIGAAGRGWSGRSAAKCCVQPHTMRGASSAAAIPAVSSLEPASSLAYGLRN